MESRRARTPAPKPCISCSQVATGSPGSIRQPTTRGSPGRGVVFPAAACRAFSAPAGSSPGRGLPEPKPTPSPRAPEMRSPFSGEGTARGARSSPLPREPDRSFQAAGTPGERKPDRSLSPRGQKVERRVERRARRAQETSEAWSRRAGTREQRDSLGNPGSKRPWGQGPDTLRASAGPARREG